MVESHAAVNANDGENTTDRVTHDELFDGGATEI
jgi:hypothetical protein